MSAADAPSSCGNLLDKRAQVGRRFPHRPVNSIDFSGNVCWIVQRLLLDRAKDRFHAMGDANHDSRTDSDSFRHSEPDSRFRDD